MNQKLWMSVILAVASFACQAEMKTCPDPQTSSLKVGKIPEPWQVNPYSANRPQADENTQFARANILFAGMGQGVVCTYKNSIGLYSIWWQVRVKVPAREDYSWISTLGGFVCDDSIMNCQFSVAK
jgi:hypothetical protein